MTAADRYPSFRAPQANREVLCVPRWSTLRKTVPQQRATVDDATILLAGIPLNEVASDARRQLLADAHVYTNVNRELDEDQLPEVPIVVTGHQPELVHPGVWLKNFAASQLADAVGGVAVSLVIDSDLCRAASIRVLSGSIDQPEVTDVSFDLPLADMPYEQRAIADPPTWRSFGDRVQAATAPLVGDPLIGGWWPDVISAAETTPEIGYAIAQARHRLETDWGNRTLELPQSHVCQTRPFRLFALHLLAHAADFRESYNDALRDYRQAHRLRNAAQPLPNLAAVDGWLETPFWIWTDEDPTRRPLYSRRAASSLLLSDRGQWQAALPPYDAGGSSAAIDCLAAWEHSGIKIRTRALATTLYTRLLLADTFIHGIGGAKYDQVTNELCRRFLGVELPQYITLSGTLQLPIEHQSIPRDRMSKLKQLTRQLRFHPEKHLASGTLSSADQTKLEHWKAIKNQWVQTPKTIDNAAERHAQITAANEALYPHLHAQHDKYERELAVIVSQTRKNQLLESREFPFCLYPRDYLQDFLLDFSSRMP